MKQFDSGGVGIETRATAPKGLTESDLVRMYEYMVLARSLDERMWLLNRAGQAPFVISCQGHEAAQVGAAFALQPGKDVLVPYYRDLAMVLYFGLTPRDLMLSLLARKEDPTSAGRQMPGHYGSRKHNIITGSSPVATQVLHATGIALAAKYRREDTVAWTCVGEGGTSQGDFHEALNFASIHRLPVVFFVENNGYAISVPQRKQMAIENVADRAAGYGMPGVTVDGGDPVAVYTVAKEAVDRARAGGGPTLIEAKVQRLTAHSSDDDDRTYRDPEELKAERAKDPIVRFRTALMEQGVLTEEQDAAIRARIKAQIDDATDFAEQAPYPDPAELMLHVYGS
ncbi:thiamine pyrophosphate-dependent dehydrogenase E1 component subunit alpha [Sphaerobacter thermophilus]|jgi:2-oxoisovalerate dehydrogenase E1 component alpha subunit|uniref:thiamine pyrophosphate-dependent dehydrogenase E1 component subunit alpha n=1 Tax=Sphaerobacter thermophilus TaxID=2057 RepID=UPI000DB792DA|nr:MAG: 2-oxoisovalerate dehydrogenase [Sphaerobacter thermophilus]